MSIQFAKNETVVRRFDYATLGYRKKTDSYATSRSLIVTNRRVIHQDVCEQAGRDLIVRQEMPIEEAKFVDVRYTKTSKPGHLIAALILAVLAVAFYFLTNLKAAYPDVALLQKIPALVFIGAAGVLGIIALINLINYFCSFRAYLGCTVSTDSAIQPIFSNTISDEKISPRKAKQAKKNTLRMELDIRINKKAAKELADGLGAAILDAIEMNREDARAACAPTVAQTPMACCANANEPCAEEPTVEEPIVDEAEAVAEEPIEETPAEENTEETPAEETVEETVEEEIPAEETPDEETPAQQ